MTDEPMSEAEIEAYNRRELWHDVANHLRVAQESVEQAQGSLEDLGLNDHADQLSEIKDQLRRAANDATEQSAA